MLQTSVTSITRRCPFILASLRGSPLIICHLERSEAPAERSRKPALSAVEGDPATFWICREADTHLIICHLERSEAPAERSRKTPPLSGSVEKQTRISTPSPMAGTPILTSRSVRG